MFNIINLIALHQNDERNYNNATGKTFRVFMKKLSKVKYNGQVKIVSVK